MSTELADRVKDAIPVLTNHVLARLHEAQDMIEQAEYEKAAAELAAAQQRLARLVWMEQNIAPFSASMVIKVKDAAEGMELNQWGVISEISKDAHTCGGGAQHIVYTLKFESGYEVHLDADDELMLVASSD